VTRDRGEAPIDGRCNNRFLAAVDGVCEVSGNARGEACPCNELEGLVCTCRDAPCCNALPFTRECSSAPDGNCQPPPVLQDGELCGSHPKGLSNHIGVCGDRLTCYRDFAQTPRCVPERQAGQSCESVRFESSRITHEGAR
jgi:hypothetical protein